MYLTQLQLHGSSQGTGADFRRIVRYIEEKKIQLLVGGVYKLSDFYHALGGLLTSVERANDVRRVSDIQPD